MRGFDAWGLDVSQYAIQHSVAPQYCQKGDVLDIQATYPVKFDYIVLHDVLQCLELEELIRALEQLKIHCTKTIFVLDKIHQPQSEFALSRTQAWYRKLLMDYGWQISNMDRFMRNTFDKELIVMSNAKTHLNVDNYPTTVLSDPWLVHHDNTNVMSCTLTTSEVETASFIDYHSDMWMTPHLVPESGTRVERERLGILRGSGDYVFVSDDTARISTRWLHAALAQFRDPSVGAVVSPVCWSGELSHEEAPGDDCWKRFPMMFRTLAYQQSQGQKRKFEDVGWKLAVIKQPISAHPQEDRDLDERESVTIVTALDDCEPLLLNRYLDALLNVDYPKELLHVHLWSDISRPELQVILSEFICHHAHKFETFCLRQSKTEAHWLEMEEPRYYRWDGVKYPISALVSCVYNRAKRAILTDRVLIWEFDTIPVESNFLTRLNDELSPVGGAISGHYVCRREKKSLAWKLTTNIPLDFEWITPGVGVQVVDAVPHGMLLMNAHCLKKFKFSALANDPRDLRGPDLVMGRDFQLLGLSIKIHWGVIALHYERSGETCLRP
jgi:hypothetical protein